MEKLYRVFISSTYTDLIEARQEVMRVLMRRNLIPSGMEAFNASGVDQWDVIKRVIDRCDYYLVIVGNRYGTEPKGGLSYTQREYEYALETKKHILGFVHEKPDTLPIDPAEDNPETRAKLANFRALVMLKPCGFWKDDHHLGGLVLSAMDQAIDEHPQEGWVRPSQMMLELSKTAPQARPPEPQAEISVSLGYQKVAPSNGAVHHYVLTIAVINETRTRIDDWEIVLGFPTMLLQPNTEYGIRVESLSTARRSVFRWDGRKMTVLRPREPLRLNFNYMMNDDRHDRMREWLDEKVTVQASAYGTIVCDVERPIQEFVNF